ncbi:HNH endonuclease [Dolichospermum sp. ST_sed5]|nr:HNH endonuclease [Dolichospermum sp. ST_sed5]
MQYKWCAAMRSGLWYAERGQWNILKNAQRGLPLHRFLLNPKPWEQIDHINGDALDNRRCNLRIVTASQNYKNRRKQSNPSSSRYKGVTWRKDCKKWMVRIMNDRKNIFLGYFADESNAAYIYDKAAKKYHGEYARLNFPAESP